MAIPKTIHYCWFGGNPKPKLAEKCIKSWKRFAPDCELVEWNEENFDITTAPLYVRQAYEAKKWAFVTDYARLKILYDYGGVYFDTDVELIKPIAPLFEHDAFMGIERARDCHKVASGLGIGAQKGFALIREIMEDYDTLSFYKEDGSEDVTTCTVLNTEVLKKHGFVEEDRLQTVAGSVIYPSEYFSPMDMTNGKMYRTKNTYSIHHYGLSWTTEEHRAEHQKAIRHMRRLDVLYNIKVLPNTLMKKLLGGERYEVFKSKIGKGR